MAARRVGTLRPEDRTAFVSTARRLGLDPYEFGALVHQESGFNPNIWGGAGGKYYGLIQFGGPERKEAGLDPNKIGKYTIAEQLPSVEKWLLGRGYKPGAGIERAYATILGGNPNVNLNAKDSFGTSVAGSVPRFRRGGDLYQRAQSTLGDLETLPSATVPTAPQQQPQQKPQDVQVVRNIFLGGLPYQGDATNPYSKLFLDDYTRRITEGRLNIQDLLGMAKQESMAERVGRILSHKPNYLDDPYQV